MVMGDGKAHSAERVSGPYPLGKVTGVDIYANDAVVVRDGDPRTPEPGIRQEIVEFSAASRKRLAFVASNTEIEFHTMITLTYPGEYSNDGVQVKGNLREFLTWLKKDMGAYSYLWFLEFQQRGAPHFHILIDRKIRGRAMLDALRFRVSANWYQIVGSKDTKHLAAGTRVERIRKRDGARHYAVKYAQKTYQKIVPEAYRNVGRFWGCSVDVKPKPVAHVQCTEDDIRAQLEGWGYAPRDDRPVYRVLYNQADRFRREPTP
jgi:hypothetical protein